MLALKFICGACLIVVLSGTFQVGSKKCLGAQGQDAKCVFDPGRALTGLRHAPRLVNFRGEVIQTPAVAKAPSAEQVAQGKAAPSLRLLSLRDPRVFVAGQLHEHYDAWDQILPKTEDGDRVRTWVKEGVDVEQYFKVFKGKFKGVSYSSGKPLPFFQENAPVCERYKQFVTGTLEEWISCGAVRVVGKVGEVPPPLVVMPLTVEPSKPRLCHAERYLNLWVRDSPFTLDTLRDVPRMVVGGSFMTSLDHKSGYQHVKLTEGSQKYFGLCWQGYYLVYTTLPFGFKASCFIYHTLSLAVISYGRDLGVPSLGYIDDSLNAEFKGELGELDAQAMGCRSEELFRARIAVYIMCELWDRLGYTLSLSKSVFDPTQVLQFLGMLVNSIREAFILPEVKKVSFASIREEILSQRAVGIKSLQRLQVCLL